MPSKMVKVWISADEFYPWYSYDRCTDGDWRHGKENHRVYDVPGDILKEYDKVSNRLYELMDELERYASISNS